MEKSSNINFISAAVLGAVLAVYVLLFATGLSHGKRRFILSKNQKPLLKLFARPVILLILAGCIYLAFYKISILALNGGLLQLAGVVFAWIIVLFITEFFPKSSKPRL